jgi:transposase
MLLEKERYARTRAPEHNHGRQQTERATRWETHAAEQCPQCGTALAGGWIMRRVQVIDLPSVAPLEVTQHRIVRRQCPRCGTRVVPPVVGAAGGRIGRCRFGPRLVAAIVTTATVERLPGRLTQERLAREHGLWISHGAIIGLLRRMAAVGTPSYVHLEAAIRASAVVHADGTGWRENGTRTMVWTTTTAQTTVVHHGRRTSEAIDAILSPDFGGTIVADRYAACNHFPGRKQRFRAHLVRELETLLHEQIDQPETVAWTEAILTIYSQARAPRPPPEEGWTEQASRARERRAQQCEAQILLLCPATLDPTVPHATLAARCRSHLAELFTFVRDPAVPATNDAAERSLRPLVHDHRDYEA